MLITYLIVSGVALLLTGIFGTVFMMYQLGKLNVKLIWFSVSYAGFVISMMMGVIFIGQTCAFVANMS